MNTNMIGVVKVDSNGDEVLMPFAMPDEPHMREKLSAAAQVMANTFNEEYQLKIYSAIASVARFLPQEAGEAQPTGDKFLRA